MEATLPRKLVRTSYSFHHPLSFIPISNQLKIILLNNDFSSIPVTIESGLLVFDIMYLMPVCNPHIKLPFYVEKICRLDHIQRSLQSLQILGNAASA